jgi:hypothetical protein
MPACLAPRHRDLADTVSRVEDARTDRHHAVGAALAGLDDESLGEWVAGAARLGDGIGGQTAVVRVGDVPVFVKRVPLTDLERRPEHVGSTANLFGLPNFYQYGVGSTGFGAWRELAAHRTTTDWVLTGRSARFPLLYHWRVLPAEPNPAADIDAAVAYWDGSPAVRGKLEAISGATAAVVLFLEYVPQTLHEWLLSRFDGGDSGAAVEFADRELHALVDTLQADGTVHFDAHPGNVLCDGQRLYLGDMGLLMAPDFALTPAEADFLARHREWDRYDVKRYLVNWLCRRLRPDAERTAVIRDPAGLPDYAADVIRRDRPQVLMLNEFYDRLTTGSKSTPFPG